MGSKKNIKEQILFATKKELAEKGFNGTRMSSIAERADTTKSLIYYYFENKENLYSNVLDKIFGLNLDKIEKKFDEYLQSDSLSPEEKLHMAIYFIMKIHFSSLDPDYQKIMYHWISEKRNETNNLLFEYFIRRLSKLEQIIIDGINLGVFESSSPILIVINLVVFIMTFETNKHFFVNSPWKETFSNKEYKQNIENFILKNTFKSLKPEGKNLKIPKMSEATKRLVDMLVEQIQENQKWDTE